MPRVNASPACCQCRARKLACSRNKPACLNCQKRNEECLYPLVPGGFKRTTDGSFELIDLTDPNEIKYDIWEKNMRLKRMEESGIPVNPNEFIYTRKIKKDISQLNPSMIGDSTTIGIVEGKMGTPTSELVGPSNGHMSDWAQNNSLSRWKRRKQNEADNANDFVVADLSDLSGGTSLLLNGNAIVAMTLPKLQDYTMKLINNLKNMEQKLLLSKESSNLIGINNVPVFNDLYDILFNNEYGNIIALDDNLEIIKKQVVKLKDRLNFLERELKYRKTGDEFGSTINVESETPRSTLNFSKEEDNDVGGNEEATKASERDSNIENFDDSLFKDSVPFLLWKKDKQPFDTLYGMKNIIAVSPELQALKKKLERELRDIDSTKDENGVMEISELLKPVSLHKVSFEQSVFLLDYFNNYYISNDILPKKLFKLFESNSYKKNLHILRDLNMTAGKPTSPHTSKEDALKRGRKAKGEIIRFHHEVGSGEASISDSSEAIKQNDNTIDITKTSKLENLLILEYNIIDLIALTLIKNNNPSKTDLTNSHLNMIKEFEENNIDLLEANVTEFYNWCITFQQTENVDKLRVIKQILDNLKDPIFYKWDLINLQDKHLMGYQIDVIKSKEQFLGLKSVIRLFDYDNRLLKQLSNNINLTNSKIDYILNELFKQLVVGKFKDVDEFFESITQTTQKSSKSIIDNIDVFLTYLNYNLYWKYYKVINIITFNANNRRKSRNTSVSKKNTLITAFKNEESNNEPLLNDLFSSILSTLSNIIEISSLNVIAHQYALLNSKISYILISLVTVFYSLHHLNASMFKQTLKNFKLFFVMNMDDISLNFKNDNHNSLLNLLEFYIANIEDTERNPNGTGIENGDGSNAYNNSDEPVDKEPMAYESIVKDFNDILLASINAGKLNHPSVDQSTNESKPLTPNALKSISHMFS